jgi:hypothetical protein
LKEEKSTTDSAHPLMTPKQAAVYLGVSENALEHHRRDDTGPLF